MTPERLLEHAENVQLEILKDEMVSILQESIKDVFDKSEPSVYGIGETWSINWDEVPTPRFPEEIWIYDDTGPMGF